MAARLRHIKNVGQQTLSFFRWLLLLAGIIFVFFIVLAFTSLPFYQMHKKGTAYLPPPNYQPEYVILMGGAGMPSPSNLMRAYYTASVATNDTLPKKVVVALPGAREDSVNDVQLLVEELVMRGVPRKMIILENKGTNTRQQALECAKIVDISSPVVLVSSPVHIPRAVRSFQKAGFKEVYGYPTFNVPNNADLKFNEDELGDRKLPGNVGENINLRYRFWYHMELQILLLREFIAMQYYRLLNWV